MGDSHSIRSSGAVAYELRAIRSALDGFVKKDDCSSNMDGHCVEIRNLWGETRKQGERLSRVEAIIENGDEK